MFPKKTVEILNRIKTPFYYYDISLLKKTLENLRKTSSSYGYLVHYALKANANEKILNIIRTFGLSADCVSGNEVKQALKSGFKSNSIAFAGVGKTDEEIIYSIKKNIFCFNCESIQELQVINDLAGKLGKKANIALRINPHINPKTHHYITTGLEENKFGINIKDLGNVVEIVQNSHNLYLTGIHFHIGSQITDLNSFKRLCIKANEIIRWFTDRNILLEHINVGGGLGIDYQNPDENSIPDFASYFKMFHDFLDLNPHQKLHFELGRSVVAQCGSLISRTLYVKKGIETNFLILDAGMTELIRPALYQAFHKIENISAIAHGRSSSLSQKQKTSFIKYDVVGPICESSDCFGKAVMLPETCRGDLVAIRSSGAYGEVMSSSYNLRARVKAVYSDDLF